LTASLEEHRSIEEKEALILSTGKGEVLRRKGEIMGQGRAVRWVGILTSLITSAIFSITFVLDSEARNLSRVFLDGYDNVLNQVTLGLGGASALDLSPIPATLAAAISQSVTQEFPLASVSPAFTYRYNSNLNIFERTTGVPGPLFSERALTLGQGKLNFSLGYAYVDFTELNGTDLHNLRSEGFLAELFPNDAQLITLPTGEPVVDLPFSGSVLRTRMDLNAHVFVPALRYGITEHWDVSVAIPVIQTFLRIKNDIIRAVDNDPRALRLVLRADGQGGVISDFVDSAGTSIPAEQAGFVARFVKSKRPSARLDQAAGSATGIGDISLRTKYHLWRTELGGAAVGLNLLLPSGEEDDFHGTGETHVSPFVYLSQVFGDHYEPHLNVGLDFNADDVDRSSFLYAVGITVLAGRGLSIVADFIGRSEFARAVQNPQPQSLGFVFDRKLNSCTPEQPCPAAGARPVSLFPEKIKRNDIHDFSVGLRYALGMGGSVFFGVLFPLNDDGFRTDFVPAGGLEYTF
jgi:hypothetical protein